MLRCKGLQILNLYQYVHSSATAAFQMQESVQQIPVDIQRSHRIFMTPAPSACGPLVMPD